MLCLAMSKLEATMCDKPDESRQTLLFTVDMVSFSLQTVFVSLRIITRWVVQRHLWIDDWLLLGAMVSYDNPISDDV
jgi:hypothetical protein